MIWLRRIWVLVVANAIASVIIAVLLGVVLYLVFKAAPTQTGMKKYAVDKAEHFEASDNVLYGADGRETHVLNTLREYSITDSKGAKESRTIPNSRIVTRDSFLLDGMMNQNVGQAPSVPVTTNATIFNIEECTALEAARKRFEEQLRRFESGQ